MPSRLRTVARRLVERNVAASAWTADRLRLPSDKPFWQRFERGAGEALAALPDGGTAIDLGGGRRCVYAGAIPRDRDVRVVAVDVDAGELARNADVHDRRVADVADGLPFPDASVDLVISRAVLEHVSDVGAAARHAARVTRPGGVSLHFVPGRWSLFGIAARALPFGPLLAVLHRVSPKTVGQVEFDTVYDRCDPPGLERAFREAGFREVRTEVTWAQPGYFEHVFPLFLLTSAYEALVRRLGLRRLAAYTAVRAVR
jgi:SAM-dependent methyltransferase